MLLTFVLLPVPCCQAAERTPDLSMLATALATAGLADTFRNPNITFTVFAPTSECQEPWGGPRQAAQEPEAPAHSRSL